MRIPFARGLGCLAASALLGCYLNRATSNYDDVYEITNSDDNAILDETERSEVDEARIREKLEAIEREPEPVYRLNAGDEVEIRVFRNTEYVLVTLVLDEAPANLE